MGSRLKITFALFMFVFTVIIARLFYWQIIKGKDLSNDARRQYQLGKEVRAKRGNILSNDESWLAGSVSGWLIYASIPEVKNIESTADKLAPFLVEKDISDEDNDYKQALLDEASKIKSLLKKEGVVWVPLKRKVDMSTKKNIEALGLNGIGFEEEDLRFYPEASAAAQLLGFVGKDKEGNDKGYFGLEGYYDLVLSGKPGYLSRDADVEGALIAVGNMRDVSAIGGVDLITHIDKGIQFLVEKKLREGIEKYGAKSGTIIVMNPKNGAVLAMSSYPSYDPLKYFEYSDEYFKNPAVSDTFEPGSVFKVIVMTSALDAKVVEPDTKCDICSGPLKVDKYYIRTWNDKYRPDETMVDVIVHSDNVGMAFVGQKMGADLFYDYLTKFGIGKSTGVDLQGEASPKLREKGTWNIVDLSTASFGQGVAVTPIQIITAVSSIANGGLKVTPQVVDKLQGDGWEKDIKPIVGERIISKRATDDMTAMMVEAAEHGEAQWTYLKGFSVAGKTGTAQIPIAGHYDKNKTIVSFIGFAPSNDPKFIMFITLREPESSPWASETAAPLWYDIAKDLFMYFGIQPEK